MHRIVQRHEIDAGHRLVNHESKCRNVHGHRYVFELILESEKLDAACGRVVDFGEVKRTLGGWLDVHLDHGFIAQADDPVIDWLNANGQKIYVMDAPPSVENIAAMAFDRLSRQVLPEGVRLAGLRVWETPNCRAEVGHVG